jgi:hypothetical protein
MWILRSDHTNADISVQPRLEFRLAVFKIAHLLLDAAKRMPAASTNCVGAV